MFRFNKVNTTPAGGITTPAAAVATVTASNKSGSGDESPATKRKLSTENGSGNGAATNAAAAQIKKPRNDVT